MQDPTRPTDLFATLRSAFTAWVSSLPDDTDADDAGRAFVAVAGLAVAEALDDRRSAAA